jgi:hypothetical protein
MLRPRVSSLSSLVQPAHCLLAVLRQAKTTIKSYEEGVLGLSKTLISGSLPTSDGSFYFVLC